MEAGLDMPAMPDEITIYCDAVTGHPKKRREVVIQGFIFNPDMDDMPGRGWTDHIRSPRLQRSKAHLNNARGLIGDTPFESHTRDADAMQEGQPRESYSLKCPFCGMTVAMRGEKLYKALDTLREYGVSRIELGALAATLGNMNGS